MDSPTKTFQQNCSSCGCDIFYMKQKPSGQRYLYRRIGTDTTGVGDDEIVYTDSWKSWRCVRCNKPSKE